MTLLGFYWDCDTARCLDHAPVERWPGFEEWPEPLAIFSDSEADTPTHCDVCEALLPHSLTSYGHAYVLELVTAASGRPEILAQWAAEYLDPEQVPVGLA